MSAIGSLLALFCFNQCFHTCVHTLQLRLNPNFINNCVFIYHPAVKLQQIGLIFCQMFVIGALLAFVSCNQCLHTYVHLCTLMYRMRPKQHFMPDDAVTLNQTAQLKQNSVKPVYFRLNQHLVAITSVFTLILVTNETTAASIAQLRDYLSPSFAIVIKLRVILSQDGRIAFKD